MNIYCVKIGTKFTSQDVNDLYKMCRKNITIPFDFFCYTDDSKNINENIRVINYIEQNLDVVVYNKLFLLSEYIYNNTGRPEKCLYFDIDMIIKFNIDKLIEFDAKRLSVIKCTWKDTHIGLTGPPWFDHNINSSCMMWSPKFNFHIWEHFLRDPDFYMVKYKNGMDPYLYYEHHQRGDLPKEFFYSHYYGGDLKHTEWARGEDGNIQWHLVKDYLDTLPIALLNGGGLKYRSYYKKYYED